MASCFASGSFNLLVYDASDRCSARFDTVQAAMTACDVNRAWCVGVTRDFGLLCGGEVRKRYEMRTGEQMADDRYTSWIRTARNASGSCPQAYPVSAHRKQHQAIPIAALRKQTHHQGDWSPHIRAAASALKLEERRPGLIHSHAHCVGPCCSTPLQRNRTCTFSNILFRPPHNFYFVTDEPYEPSVHATYLHNRFAPGSVLPRSLRSRFELGAVPRAAAANVTRLIAAPLYIQADLHSNVGHNMLDSIFPAVANLLRLEASRREGDGGRGHGGWLPRAVTGNYTLLLVDTGGSWHRGAKERAFADAVSGNGVVDLEQLAGVCPDGCLIRSSWVGAGHIGLCAVDAHNVIGGAREHRALFRFRQRIYHSYRVPLLPPPEGERSAAPPLVLVVQSKRMVTNLAQLVAGVNALGTARAELTRWESMSLAAQLAKLRTVAVLVSGVGTAMQNTFLLPAGAVAICLGWRQEESRHGIQYFDSHIMRSLDHVRALYYPSYDSTELGHGGANAVTLKIPKALALVQQALTLYRAGFAIPLALDANANRFDRAFAQLNREMSNLPLMLRTNDLDWGRSAYPHKSECSNMNGVNQMFFGPSGRLCPWSGAVSKLIAAHDL